MTELTNGITNGVKTGITNGVHDDENSFLNDPEPIAIVGMGCRLPGGISNTSEFWEFLELKKSAVRDFDKNRINVDGFYHSSHQRPGSINTKGGCFLDEDPRLFDHSFFGMTPGEVMTMDPLQRKLLEVAYEAFESAGEPWDKFSGSDTGVFVGNFNSDHSIMQMYDVDFPLGYASTGGSVSSLSNRINHLLNLRGPSQTIDTACSSSMYALHSAVNAIRSGDCSGAIVGGSNLILAPEMQLLTVKLGALSPTSTCHTFDASADGYGRGEGFGALYLKKYSDAIAGGYPIRALIRGTAVNANGRTAGISHPSVEGQESLIRKTYRNAGLPTNLTAYFECHGTGTPTGDPIEVAAIGKVFGPERKQQGSQLLIGSVKTNLGHAEPSSGVIGVIKTVLALEKGTIPATVGVKNLNPNIDFTGAHVKVVTETTLWPSDLLRRASVNSFGYGGSNAHCILDHESVVNSTLVQPTATPTRRLVLLPFSAHDESSLRNNIDATRHALPNLPLADVAYTLSNRRSKFLYKTFAIVESTSPAQGLDTYGFIPKKSLSAQPTSVGFVFTGQGAQWEGMGASLLEYSEFKTSLKAQDTILAKLPFSPPWNLEHIISGCSKSSVMQPGISQTACTALQIALVDLLQSWNITPEFTLGHSSGEIAAAYAGGYISLAEAITIAYCRGKAIENNYEEGLMLAVGKSQDELVPLLEGIESQIKIAAINSPGSCTLSGDASSIKDLHKRLLADGAFVRLLQTGGNAYHSHHMTPVGLEYQNILETALYRLESLGELTCSKRQPSVRMISSVMPTKQLVAKSMGPSYWRQNLESPVLFSEALEVLLAHQEETVGILIEVGPHSALQSPIKQVIAKSELSHGIKAPTYMSVLKRNEDSMSNILNLCGQLFCLEYPVNLGLTNSAEVVEQHTTNFVQGSVCVDLPTYRYNYGVPIYYENRISREIKQRRYLRHDILGVLQAGCAKERPAWRNILRMKDVPWLKDHQLLPNPVLPASGYVCLAIEAASQFINTRKESSDDFCFRIRNLSIKAAMILADDDFGLETMVNLEASSHSSNWLEFEISSVSTTTDTWTEHASGLISRVPQPSQPLEPLDKSFDARIINVKDWYEKFTDIGLGYGKSFQGLTDLSSDPERCISKAKVMLNTTKGMFKGQESSYIIHPASLDLCHQLALIACHGGQAGRVKNAFIPVFIDDMTIWPQRYCEEWGGGTAVGHLKGLRGAHASVQLLDQSGAPRLAINQLRCVAHFGGSAQNPDNLDPPSPYTRLTWKPDISTLTSSQAKELFPPPISLGAVQNIFDAMDKVSVFMVIELATKYRNFVCKDSYLQRFLLWLQNSAVKLQQQHEEVFQMSSENRLKTIENVCSTMEDVVDIKHTKRVFDNIFAILTGTTTGVEVSLQDGNLAELYASGVGIAAAYPQLERILDLASHRDPSMKILEIGAGTGSATHRAMRSLGADMGSGTCKRYSGYAFTDTSSAFLETAKVKFRNCKQVTYATLDINRCPFEQGFEQSYDLIIASQCLHATEDIHRTLENVHKLLKPGGRVVLLETTRPLLGHGLAYGTFPDYWKSDENPDSPFLDVGQWENELKKAGFSGIDIELQDYDPSVAIVSVIVATSLPKQSAVVLPVTEDDVYIIYNQQLTTFHEVLASELRGRGITPLLISFDSFSLPSKSRVIFAVDLDLHVLIDGEEKDFERVKDIVRTASSLLWLTNGGLLAGDDPSAALGTGLIRMLNTENPLSNFGIFHLQGNDCFGSPVAGQIAERELRLHTGDSDTEFALHKGVVHVSRLELDVDLNARYLIQNRSQLLTEKTSFPINAPMVADFETPGILSSLYFKKDSTLLAPLGDDFIEVKTSAIGLNWKDIAVSAGRIDMNFFSSEVSGVVTRCGSKVSKLSPGDRVYCLGWGKFGTRIQLHASFAQLMSQTESFTDMVSVPMAFCTAVYALNHLARLQKGEKILIQSATGGVGLAAIQIALSKGAEIFTTVGSEDKIRYLVGTCHIPRERIFSSRDLNDIPRLKAAVSGRGFDVILSSSNRDMLHETCRLIAPRGRFVDVGRVDVQNHSTMAMEIFSQNATFSSFDLSVMAVQDPQFCSELGEEVNNLLRQGVIRPIPEITIFDVSELDQALLYLSRGQHIGKVVVTYENPESIIKMIPPPPEALFDPNAEYIIAGGLGGLGRCILQWIVSRGAQYLTMISRSNTPGTEATTMINQLASRNIRVQLKSCDVTIGEDVTTLIRHLTASRPVKGILHAAAIIQDRLFDTLPYSQWKHGLAAKVQGTMNLHNASVDLKLPLDFFIMTSSFEAVVAMPTQATYCAANCFQDAFSRYRKAQGLPSCAIAFGLITEIGDFGQRDITRNMIRRHGLYPTGELAFLKLLEAAFLEEPECTSTWSSFDPLAGSQITTCLEPSFLAKMAKKQDRNTAETPRWWLDKKFSHLVRAMEDHLALENVTQVAKETTPAIIVTVDNAIRAGDIQNAGEIITEAIMERVASLLMIPSEGIAASKSVANYGVDSLIAVELRSWLILLFGSEIPLLKLLDESVSIGGLGEWIAGERRGRLEN